MRRDRDTIFGGLREYGLGLADPRDPLLDDLWEGRPPDALWTSLGLFYPLVKRRSLVRCLLYLEKVDVSSKTPFGQRSESMEHTAIASEIYAVARSYGHTKVNEVHLLVALLQLQAAGVVDELERLGSLRRQAEPFRTERQIKILEFAKSNGMEKFASHFERSIQRNPLQREAVLASADEYLRSKWFPYGESEWRRYGASPKDSARGWADDASPIGFAIRLRRDGRLD